MSCPLCDVPPDPSTVLVDGPRWRVVGVPLEADDAIRAKRYVTLVRHAESLAELTDEEAAELGPLLQRVVDELERTEQPARVHVGSYGEEVRHVHFHVTPRPSRYPRGNVPFALAQDAVGLARRLRRRYRRAPG